MPEAVVDLGAGVAPLAIRINGATPTFRLGTDRIAAKLLAPLDPRMEDLLEIAATVFAADSSVARGGATRAHMGRGWRRQFNFSIPVRDVAFWGGQEVAQALVDATSFLTDDEINFQFVRRGEDEGVAQQGYLDFDPGAGSFAADEVILFSGGLDSFAGALEALSTRGGKVALVTHRSAQKVISRQERLGKYLSERFPGRVLHIAVNARRVGAEAAQSTQRSRSLLFACLGQVVARMLGAQQVSFYENGIVSHNLPISPQVIGTMATRTTHPLALYLLGALMDRIGEVPVPIRNPFAWATKTDVVGRIAVHGAKHMILDAVSCTSVRDQNNLHTHCGACSQCLDRRFALLAAGLAAEDPAEMYRTDVLIGEREVDRSRTMAVDWTRHALRLSTMELRGFLDAFGQELLRIAKGNPDTAPKDVVRQCLEMHQRQGNLVVGVLKGCVSEHAEALARHSLPSTCLLALHLGDGTAHVLPEDPRRVQKPVRKDAAVADVKDIVPDANRPLEVSFVGDDKYAIVIVKDLCRVTGQPAKVAHILKVPFDEDRAEGRIRADHRHLQAGIIADKMVTSKDGVAQNVNRCRKTVEGAFAEMFGHPPHKDLLIETRKSKGYRLDPDLRIVAPDD